MQDNLREFFREVGRLHASNIENDLAGVLPLMRRYPDVVVENVASFRNYFAAGVPANNIPYAISSLSRIAQAVPESRPAIIRAA